MSLQIAPIGILSTPYREKFGTPRQGPLASTARGTIDLFPHFKPEEITLGLEGFSHVWLITWLDRNRNDRSPTKIEAPRLGGARIGTLASRSPHRPNPLALTLVRLEKIVSGKIHVLGVDLMDQTPVIDIKPYLLEADQPSTEIRCGWIDSHPWKPLNVTLAPSFETSLQRLLEIEPLEIPEEELRALVREVLALDPRPIADRERSPTTRDFWLRLYDYDVRFHFENHDVIASWIRFARQSPKYFLFSDEEAR